MLPNTKTSLKNADRETFVLSIAFFKHCVAHYVINCFESFFCEFFIFVIWFWIMLLEKNER